ncbi:hypothetical protein NEMBOFW57_004429 [Staphylotrichum longicolle]|uniref:LicD/FKTN/FKRP nucleotidyltransferase domain-containing protein n=1 Tax=Staphylotrichum longicolle TaxID=669026 RepID=A0AAD4F6B6_9PEZI|nr:hypothetical protein NEMBOFW57_004429 [Staphylotrichum longicolle]
MRPSLSLLFNQRLLLLLTTFLVFSALLSTAAVARGGGQPSAFYTPQQQQQQQQQEQQQQQQQKEQQAPLTESTADQKDPPKQQSIPLTTPTETPIAPSSLPTQPAPPDLFIPPSPSPSSSHSSHSSPSPPSSSSPSPSPTSSPTPTPNSAAAPTPPRPRRVQVLPRGGLHVRARALRRALLRAAVPYDAHRAVLSHLVRAYLTTLAALHLETWLAHGTLLGWWWNGLTLPWDYDLDAQVSGATMRALADRHNGSLHEYRYVDAETGREETRQLYPLRETEFEGVQALVPWGYEGILVEEYGEKSLVTTEWEGHVWKPDIKQWVKKNETETEATL